MGSSGDQCWGVLTDVDRISGWISVVGDVREVEHLARYSAVLADRMGPFTLKADLDVLVTDLESPRSITIRADGEDRQVGSRITVDATLSIDPTGDGSVVNIRGDYEVTGRIATMGSSTIRQKATKLLEEFAEAARHDLG